MGYIGKHGVESLKKYKYSGVDRSFIAKYVLQPFWTKFVLLFPLWMPPNMITLCGFLMVLTSSAISYVYSPHLTEAGPAWTYFAHGALLFFYQTFDAVDGKQARRTNSSSPLGELFDHGCDALTCAFETMAFGSSFLAGRNSFWFWVIASMPFYGATWESYFTNALILPEINGPTEGLMLIYLVHFLTSIIGPTWWTLNFRDAISFLRPLPFIPDMPVNIFVLCVMIAPAAILTIGYNFWNVYKVVHAKKGSMLFAIAMLFPFWALVGGVVAWGFLSPSDILGTQPHLVLIGSGFAFGFLVGRLILAHLCDEPKGLKTGMSMALLPLPLAIANALSAKLLGGTPLIDELWVLLAFCAFTSSLYAHFAIGVIHELTSALGIHCFRIGKFKDIKGT